MFGPTRCTTVGYANGGAAPASFGPFDRAMHDHDGAVVDLTFFGAAQTLLPTGELSPGGSTAGQVCFADPESASGPYVLLFDTPSTSSSGRLAWIGAR